MFDTKRKTYEQLNFLCCSKNTIKYSMSINSRTSCVVGISIFGFGKYWKAVFELDGFQHKSYLQNFFHAQKSNPRNDRHTSNDVTKNNVILPQAGNGETTNIQEHPFKINWN